MPAYRILGRPEPCETHSSLRRNRRYQKAQCLVRTEKASAIDLESMAQYWPTIEEPWHARLFDPSCPHQAVFPPNAILVLWQMSPQFCDRDVRRSAAP